MKSYSTWRLAWGNIKKSVSDYVVYFITLIFGVAIFYIFNAVGDQSLVYDLSQSGYEIVKLMTALLTWASVGVAVILGFLIVYANNFLIRRRKKEFGIYLLLGMGKKQVSKILFCETLIAGMFSLAIGLGIGILGSQFLSIVVGHLFDADMSAYHFTFSPAALIITVISFAVMNLVVLIFHAASIAKYQLVDLLSAGRKTEKRMTGNPVILAGLFVISLAVLANDYYRVGFCPGQIYKGELFRILITGVVFNMLLFWSMAGFLTEVLRKRKSFYLKGLNAFLTRQFCGGINSSSISMGIICLMLFATIASFSVGFSLANEFQSIIRKSTPVDFSIQRMDGQSSSEWFANFGNPLTDWAEENYVEVPVYHTPSLLFEDTLGDRAEELHELFPRAIFWTFQIDILRVSDYNELMRKYGQRTCELKEDEYAICCDSPMVQGTRDAALAENTVLTFGDRVLKPSGEECISNYLLMSGMNANLGTVIVPDSLVNEENTGLEIAGYFTIGDYAVDGKARKTELDTWLNNVLKTEIEKSGGPEGGYLEYGTKIAVRESNNGLTMMATFLVVYMGVVFLIASAAILSLKALSESVDSIEKYQILKKIGCDNRMLRRALRIQIGSFFLLPILVAVLHAAFGIPFAAFTLSTLFSIKPGFGILVTTVVMVVFYGAYMFAAIESSKKIVGINKD